MYDASMTLAVLTITMDKECTNTLIWHPVEGKYGYQTAQFSEDI